MSSSWNLLILFVSVQCTTYHIRLILFRLMDVGRQKHKLNASDKIVLGYDMVGLHRCTSTVVDERDIACCSLILTPLFRNQRRMVVTGMCPVHFGSIESLLFSSLLISSFLFPSNHRDNLHLLRFPKILPSLRERRLASLLLFL